MRGLWPKVMNEGTLSQCAECSNMGKQLFTMKSEMVLQAICDDDLVQSVDQ
jgi:hypothetical protein